MADFDSSRRVRERMLRDYRSADDRWDWPERPGSPAPATGGSGVSWPVVAAMCAAMVVPVIVVALLGGFA